MSSRFRWLSAAVVATLAAVFVPLGLHAGAATPPWEPDPNSEGSITFYNSSGAVVTTGSNLHHLFDYAVASSAGRSGTNRATLSFGFPDHTKTDSTTWFQSPASASTIYPNSAAPAPINSFTTPVVSVGATDADLGSLLTTTTLDNTAGYANLVQVRVKDSGPGIPTQDAPFWATDISFNSTNGTWTQVYPTGVSGPVTTTTSLGTAPGSPQPTGTNVALTANVLPSTAAGTVQFKDGTNNIGSAVTVSGGTASTSTTTLAAGAHSLTAVFTPTDSNAFTSSTSTPATPYTITSPATVTTTSLNITPPSPITVGTQSTLTATVLPNNAAGTVQFKDGATNIGSAVTVSGGTASTMTTFTVNTHSVQAIFTPTDSNAFQGSQSTAQTYVVNAASATPTTTTLGVGPASPQTFGTSVTFTGTVSPSTAVGSVQFLDGSVVVGTGTVSGGVATATNSTLAAGGHSLVAAFVPTDSSQFAASQSSPAKSYTITAAMTSTTLQVSPTGPVMHGTSVLLTASVMPTAAAGNVQFFNGSAAIGAPVLVSGGTASTTITTLPVATNGLTAVFTPSTSNYSGSTSQKVNLEVDQATSSTTLAITPQNSASTGSTVTLTATVTPSSATGTVQFADGSTNINSPVTVTGGVATTTTSTLSVGGHSLTASFTSTDPNVTDSKSGSMPYSITLGPVTTNTTLTPTPIGPVSFGTGVLLSATVSPSSSVGSVAFLDGTKTLATKPVSGGVASVTVVLGGGVHSLTAMFTPTDTSAFTTSTSTAVPFTVNAISTMTALAVTPHGPILEGVRITMTATVTPATVAGSVTFRDGTRVLGTVALHQGTAQLQTNKLFGFKASLTASFTGSPAVDFGPSTSAPVTMTVIGLPKLLSVRSQGKAVPNGSTLAHGQALSMTAEGFAAGEQVSAVAHSTPVALGATHAVKTGIATLGVTIPDSLPAGSHTITLTGSHGQTTTFSFVIGGSSGGLLASTGTDLMGGTVLGLGLLVAGLLALGVVGPRRRSRVDLGAVLVGMSWRLLPRRLHTGGHRYE